MLASEPNPPLNPTDDKIVDVIMEEYRTLRQEKLLYEQLHYGTLAVLVVGSGAVLAVVGSVRPWILLLPVAQFGIVAFAMGLRALSLRNGIYLSFVESRIAKLTGHHLLLFESRGLRKPERLIRGKYRWKDLSGPNLPVSFATSIFLFSLTVLLFSELIFSVKRTWSNSFIGCESGRHVLLVAYAIAMISLWVGGMTYFMLSESWMRELRVELDAAITMLPPPIGP